LAIPEMQEIAVKYKGRLNVVSLSTDKKENWEAASKKHGFIWHNWNDMKQLSGLYAAYGVYAFPHYVLISPNGKIIESWTGYRKGLLLEKMEKLIKY
jgi:thioredoxin-related protein